MFIVESSVESNYWYVPYQIARRLRDVHERSPPKGTPERFWYERSLNHEILIKKSVASPTKLTRLEKEYVASWYTPIIAKQYALALLCTE
mmetsp:Transcript_2569/g.4383  ORF Transcript_2569/g.4383 Transcript_2569/m.4383 type:complete len:90 (+) Transcript_2569:236-505(+)